MTARLVRRPKIDPRNAPKDPLERLRSNMRRAPEMPVSFAHALNAFLADRKKLNRSRLQRVQAAWTLAVDGVPGLSEAARRAEVRSVSKTGEVHVTVQGGALAHELGVVYREIILKSLRELLQGKDSVSGLVVKHRR